MNNGLTVNCVGGQPAARCAGKPDGVLTTDPPTARPEVRQAIAAAVDPKVIDQRANDGKGLPGTEMFQTGFYADPGVAGPVYDPARAKQLVAQAKAAGWDGKVRFLAPNSPLGQNVAVAVQSMLQAVGMEVAVDTSKDTAGVGAQYIVNRDFDIVYSSMVLTNDGNLIANVQQQFVSTSPSNRTGWKDPLVDPAKTVDEKRAALKVIATQYVKDVPFLVVGALAEYVAWKPVVHGVMGAQQTMVLFNKAWLDR
jgi:peptide/nickel transport system substrate-binding protein